MADDPCATAARPCSSCGRPRAECRTPVDLFLSCCHTCAENDDDTHREPATAATESWNDVPVRDCYTKVQGQPCGPRHGWASWLTTLYVCPGTEATDQPATAARRVYARNRWHLMWVLIRDAFRHPNSDTEIVIGQPSEGDVHDD